MIEVPITSDLRIALASASTGDTTYLVNDLGAAFTINGLGNKMRDWCDAAGLKHCSAHGLRKASAVAMAESGVRPQSFARCLVGASSKLLRFTFERPTNDG